MGGAMIAYDTRHNPPAPTVQATIANVMQRRRHRKALALLDTGSDITAIPRSLASEIQVYPIGQIRLEDVQAQTQKVLTYAVQLTIADLMIPRLEVILTSLDHVILGRDVLNRLYVLLNGPAAAFDFRLTPFTSVLNSADPV
jgi:predicted aspartyl protease